MQLALDRSTLQKLLHHAASAARLIGHLDGAIAAGPLGDHIDAVVHGLTELLGDPHTLAAPDAAAPDRAAHDGAPMLAASAGEAGPVSRRDDLDIDDTLQALHGGAS